jgi:hypothetical protein
MMEKYQIRSIDYQDCKEWFLKKHYAHRIPPIDFCFGLYDCDQLIGVCSYGTPLSSKLRESVGPHKLYELNRLVVNEALPKNTLSYFVGKTICLMPKPCVLVSYADTSHNHHGYIYQATNWLYTGLSVKFMDYMVEGMEHLHGQSIMDMSRGQENRVEWLKQKFGDKLYMKERPRKHRYFYFVGDKRDIKKMRKELPYASEPYPKGDNKRYDASHETTTQIKLF